MRTLVKLCLTVIFVLLNSFAFSQGQLVSGKAIDKETGQPLIGANVRLEGTPIGTSTGLDGSFQFTVLDNALDSEITPILTISYMGYLDFVIPFTTEIGSVKLESSDISLAEVTVIANVAQDRKTPIAITDVPKQYIDEYSGTQELPELLKLTPGVYTTKQGGGVGDARINIRGFDQENVAVLINGIPVNDMENGRVYWSNWAGLGDAVRQVQVQRGLGASKLAINSIGGTINLITKSTDALKGGSFQQQISDYGQFKETLSWSTGKMKDNSALSFVFSKTDGDGYVRGTYVNAFSYFLSYSKDWNDAKHKLQFTAIGAPQKHGQRDRYIRPEDVENYGIKHNRDLGILDGEELNQRNNYYHKPQIALNHYWAINDKSLLSTSGYVSFGKGGGSGPLGSYAPTRDDGLIDWDAAYAWNQEDSTGASSTILRNSVNNHKWFGILSTLNHDVNDKLSLAAGIDGRYYRGEHFREVRNLLGGQHWFEQYKYAVDGVAGRGQEMVIDPNSTSTWFVKTPFDNRIAYDNDGINRYLGGFGQLEYNADKTNVFLSTSLSNTWYTRVDRYNYVDEDIQTSETVSLPGYTVKGGVNWNVNDNMNFYVNAGTFSRAPFMNFVFVNYQNILSEDIVNEKANSYEIGWGYKAPKYAIKINAYNTEWRDKSLLSGRIPTADGGTTRALIKGQGAIHKGIELDFNTKLHPNFDLGGIMSLGNWKWKGDVNAELQSDIDQSIEKIDIYSDGLYVGNQPQNQYGAKLRWQVTDWLDVGSQYVYNDKFYAIYDVTGRDDPDYREQPFQLDSYGTLDARIGAKFNLFGLESYAQAQVYNVLDESYWYAGRDGGGYLKDGFPGFGRTSNFSLKVNF